MNDKVTKLPTPPNKLDISFQLGDKVIDSAIVKPMPFQSFVDCINDAQNMSQPKTLEARMRRLRMVRQVTYFSNGQAITLSPDDVIKMPIPDARLISARLDDDEGKAGKITRAGDGIDKAIVYELGTPIPTGQGKAPIKELEFIAKTYGDIEDVMAAADVMTQTSLLIATIAKPLGSSLSLLPSWALNTITIADGVIISRQVLPHFLGSPVE